MLNNRIIYKYKRKLDNKFYYEKREEILKDYRMKIKNSENSLQKIYYFFEKNIRFLNLTTLQNLYYIK